MKNILFLLILTASFVESMEKSIVSALEIEMKPALFGLKSHTATSYIQALRGFAQILFYHHEWYKTLSESYSSNGSSLQNSGITSALDHIQSLADRKALGAMSNKELTAEQIEINTAVLLAMSEGKSHPLVLKASDGFFLFATTPESIAFLFRYRSYFLQKRNFDQKDAALIRKVVAQYKDSNNDELFYLSSHLSVILQFQLMADQHRYFTATQDCVRSLVQEFALTPELRKVLMELIEYQKPQDNQYEKTQAFYAQGLIFTLYEQAMRKSKELILRARGDFSIRQYSSVAKEIDHTQPMLPLLLQPKASLVVQREEVPKTKVVKKVPGKKKIKKKVPTASIQEVITEAELINETQEDTEEIVDAIVIDDIQLELIHSVVTPGKLLYEVADEIVVIDDPCNGMRLCLYGTEATKRFEGKMVRYKKNVQGWFDETEKALHEQGYFDPHNKKFISTIDQINRVIRIHRFSKSVDAYLPTRGVQCQTPGRINQINDTCVVIPGHIEYYDTLDRMSCYFVYIFGPDGICFHRNIQFNLSAQMVYDFMSKGFFDVEFPPLH